MPRVAEGAERAELNQKLSGMTEPLRSRTIEIVLDQRAGAAAAAQSAQDGWS